MVEPRDPSLAEILAMVETARAKLQGGLHTPSQGLAFRCLVFYADMVLVLRDFRVPNHRIVTELIENHRTLAEVFQQYELAADQMGEVIGHLTAFGFIHSVTQMVDGTDEICAALGINSKDEFKKIKQREYWKFRNRHSHILTWPSGRSERDPIGLNTHIFRRELTSAKSITYSTLGEAGFMSRTANVADMMRMMLFDITPVLEAIIAHCRQLPSR